MSSTSTARLRGRRRVRHDSTRVLHRRLRVNARIDVPHRTRSVGFPQCVHARRVGCYWRATGKRGAADSGRPGSRGSRACGEWPCSCDAQLFLGRQQPCTPASAIGRVPRRSMWAAAAAIDIEALQRLQEDVLLQLRVPAASLEAWPQGEVQGHPADQCGIRRVVRRAQRVRAVHQTNTPKVLRLERRREKRRSRRAALRASRHFSTGTAARSPWQWTQATRSVSHPLGALG